MIVMIIKPLLRAVSRTSPGGRSTCSDDSVSYPIAWCPGSSCSSGVICLTDAARFPLHFILRLPPCQPRHQPGELDQIAHAEQRTPSTEHHLRIESHAIRPVPRHHAPGPGLHLQQEPRSGSVVPLAHARERLPAQGVKRMRYPNKMRCRIGTRCILSRVTSGSSGGASIFSRRRGSRRRAWRFGLRTWR